PMARDIDAAADPDLLEAERVVAEAFQSGDSRRAADDARVPADHPPLWHIHPARIAFAVQHVERILEVIEELRAAVEALHRGKAHVVAVERVGHDEVRHALHDAVALDLYFAPVGQVVRVRIGVVDETAMFDDETARVRTVAAGVPAERRAG